MILIYEQSEEAIANGINPPSYAHELDSGMDIYSPEYFLLGPGERTTINLQVKFDIPTTFLGDSLGVELQVRPKSGRSKAGLEISLGTIDQGYRNFVGATIHNYSKQGVTIQENEKLCQIVVVPVFNNVTLLKGQVNADTDRGLGGFGSTGLK